MSVTLRVVLICCAFITVAFAIRRIRAAQIDIGDTMFWILFAFYLLLISIFPGIMRFLANCIGMQSPVNMVFFSIIGILSYKSFTLSLKVSMLTVKIQTLTINTAVQHDKLQEELKRDMNSDSE